MLKKRFFLVSCFVALLPALSFGFDCNKPDFGATIQELNKEGYFVKYMEKDGLSYYNYTGPCRMGMHSFANPAISYAFFEDQLYARIIRNGNEGGDPELLRRKFEERISDQVGSTQMQKKQDGEWCIYQWVNEKDNLRLKIKIHTKTNEGKSAFYYEPLRKKIKSKAQAADPVDEIELPGI